MLKKIKKILSEIRPEVDFSQSNNFLEDSLLDSLDIIKLISELDNIFNISIDGSEIIPENFLSIKTIHALVNKYI